MEDIPQQASRQRPWLSRAVIACYPENFDQAVADFEVALGIEFQVIEPEGMGLRVAMAFDAGFEIIAPSGEHGHGPSIREWLDQHGEGIQQLVVDVPDLERGVDRAKAARVEDPGLRLDVLETYPAWRTSFAKLEEAPLAPLHGVSLTLMERVARRAG